MTERVFLAGAAGAIGRALVPLLQDAGYEVHGTTRRPERAQALAALGVTPVVVDVFDSAALTAAVVRAAPAIVIHQLTDLPRDLDPKLMGIAVVRNARVRTEGTRNLVAAALASGCTRIVAQSIAWVCAPGPKPAAEDAPLDLAAESNRGITVGGVAALEQATLGAPGLTGTVLRYGQLYGPGTAAAMPRGACTVHVEAAAWAALLALRRSPGGIFNVTDDNPDVDNGKARRVLGWDPGYRAPTRPAR